MFVALVELRGMEGCEPAGSDTPHGRLGGTQLPDVDTVLRAHRHQIFSSAEKVRV